MSLTLFRQVNSRIVSEHIGQGYYDVGVRVYKRCVEERVLKDGKD
jgi:hypothetical protein